MLTAVVLAKNEAHNLPQCLESLQFCDGMVVVDDESADDTAEVARKAGAQVLQHPVTGDYAAARNWALTQVKSTWVLFVDADEQVSPQLAQEITRAIAKVECKGFLIPRIDYLWERQLKHGDVGRVKLLRLARRGAGQWINRVHEVWQIEGRVCLLRQPLLHYPHPRLVDFLRQINHYSSIRAQELRDCGQHASLFQIVSYPIFKFLYLYLVSLGILDGTPGFVHAMTMAFYTFLVRGKLWLLEH